MSFEIEDIIINKYLIKKNGISEISEYFYFPLKNIRKTLKKDKYDKHGNCIETQFYDDYGNAYQKKRYALDSKNFADECVISVKENKIERIKYRYNSYGIKIEESYYDKSDEIRFKHVYNYVQNTNKINEISIFDKNSKQTGKIVFMYADEKISAIYSYENNQIIEKNKYVYKNNALRYSYHYDKNDGLKYKATYSFFNNGLINHKVKYDENNIKTSWRIFDFKKIYDASSPEKPDIEKKAMNSCEVKISKTTIGEFQTAKIQDHDEKTENKMQQKQSENNPFEAYSEQQREMAKKAAAKISAAFDNLNMDESFKAEVNSMKTVQPPAPGTKNGAGNSEKSLEDIIITTKNMNSQQIEEFIQKCKIDINKQNEWGISVLMMAICKDNKNLVEYLIENKAQIDLRDTHGNDAYFYLNDKTDTGKEIKEIINKYK